MRTTTRYAATLGALGLVLAGCSSEAGQQAEEAAENTAEVAEDVEFPAGTTMAELAEAGTIRVGTKYDQPGFGQVNLDGVPEGFDVEIAKRRPWFDDLTAVFPDEAFDLTDPDRYRGFLLHNRFLFHNGVLDTGTTSTHWGVYFVPLPLPQDAVGDTRRVTLRTLVTDPARPSSFTLQAETAGTVSAPQSF
jgi:hypothetical protein